MKLIINETKEVEILIPEYVKIKNEYVLDRLDIFAWVKNEDTITMCGYDTLYNDETKKVFKNIVEKGIHFEAITKQEFENKVKETIDLLTLIPF